jgi:predicted nucleic acid-binding protein
MKEPVVTNSTCLISLERIGQLNLLPALFEPVMAPPKVQEEFGSSVAWLRVQGLQNAALAMALEQLVDAGEAEAIALALERKTTLVLDDRKARQVAKRLGIRIIGTVGILVRAKRQGILPAIRPHLEALKNAGFRLTPDLEEEARRLANE